MSGTEPTVPGPKGNEPLVFSSAGAPPGTLWPDRRLKWPSGAKRGVSSRSARALGWLIAFAVVVGALVGVASHEASGFFLFSPGTAPLITADPACKASFGQLALPDGAPCARLEVPKRSAHKLDGGLFMVDVEVSQAGALDWLAYQFGVLGGDHELVPVSDYAPGTPTSELACQDTQQMVSADQDAALAAMAVLGYHVGEVPLGAQVDTVYAATPAWKAGIQCNDLVTAVNGRRVRTAQQLTNLMSSLRPGTAVVLTVSTGGATRRITLKLEKPPASAVAQGFNGKGYMGVAVQTRVKPQLPFPVSVNAGEIGGPSAGLAFTLAILDTLSNGRLTGGHRVAATGTIDPLGNVGDVGGVREKTVAVEKAGAQVFFVPQGEYADAKSEARGGLAVVPVTSLRQVLQILHEHYGGDLNGLKVK